MKAKAIKQSIINSALSVISNILYIIYLQVRIGDFEFGNLVIFLAIFFYIIMVISSMLAIVNNKNSRNIKLLNKLNSYLALFQFVCLFIVFLLFMFGELLNGLAVGIGNIISIVSINLMGLVFLIFCPIILVNTLVAFIRIISRNADFVDEIA